MTMFGRHVPVGAHVLIDGRRVDATVSCKLGGTLPLCTDETLAIDLDTPPEAFGMHLLQVQTPGGLVSNEFLIYVTECGDSVCEPGGEDCSSCAADCGACGAGAGCVDWAEVAAILEDPVHGCTGTCHSPESMNGGLDLSTIETTKAGGDHGPAVVPCDPLSSYLFLKNSFEDWAPEEQFGAPMPLSQFGAVGLSVGEVDTIFNWIESGAQEVCEPDFCE